MTSGDAPRPCRAALRGAGIEKLFMRRALELARENIDAGTGGPFGAVIVRAGDIVAEGRNRVTSSNDPSAHAEIVAIRSACARLDSFRLDGCEIYTSCEPCPMCLGAIYWARLDRIYFANSRAEAAETGFDDAVIYDELALPLDRRRVPAVRLLADEALSAFREWRAKPGKIDY